MPLLKANSSLDYNAVAIESDKQYPWPGRVAVNTGPLGMDQEVWNRILVQSHDVWFPLLGIGSLNSTNNSRATSVESFQATAMNSASAKLGAQVSIWIFAMRIDTGWTRKCIKYEGQVWRGMTFAELETYPSKLLFELVDSGKIKQVGQTRRKLSEALIGSQRIDVGFTNDLQKLVGHLADTLGSAGELSTDAAGYLSDGHKDILLPITRQYHGTRQGYENEFAPTCALTMTPP